MTKPKDESHEAAGRFAYEGLERVIHEKARLGILTRQPHGWLVTHFACEKRCPDRFAGPSRQSELHDCSQSLRSTAPIRHRERPETSARAPAR